MLKKEWTCESTQHCGGYHADRFKTYKITSPSGTIYKMTNHDDKYPAFYMVTDDPNHYTKLIGQTFHEAMQTLYKMEEEKIFKPMKEISASQIYKHSYHPKTGYSLEKVDMTNIFHENTKFLHLYESGYHYHIYSTDKEEDLMTAKEMLEQIIHRNHRSYIQKQLDNYQSQLETVNSQIEEMFKTTIPKLETEEELDEER